MRLSSCSGVGVKALGLLLILALIAAATPVLQPRRTEGDSSAVISRDPTDAKLGTVRFALPACVAGGDESYAISIDGLPLTIGKSACEPEALSKVTVNGQSLQGFLPTEDLAYEFLYTSLRGTVNVLGNEDHKTHSLTLILDALCSDTHRSTSDEALDAEHYHQAFDILIVEIDKVPWKGKPIDLSSEFGNGPTVSVVAQASSTWGLDSGATGADPEAPDTSPLGDSDVVELAEDVIEQEIYRLRALQNELKAVQQSLQKQTTLVDKLTKDNHHQFKTQVHNCESISCVLGTIYQSGKECIHLAYLRYKPSSADECYEMSPLSGSSKTNVFKKGVKSCPERYIGQHRKPRPDSEESRPLIPHFGDDDESLYSYTPTSYAHRLGASPPSSSTTHHIHAILAVVASLLCLTCLTTALHRRCCNPRACADRAARREECRNRRQYRRAARQRAWMDWWEQQKSRLRVRSKKRIADYEEKRALILQQEAVLESAMQVDISRLQALGARGVVNEVLSMAEEGRVSRAPLSLGSRPAALSGGSETLPAYRSRSNSSRRPPSYNEFDQSAGSLIADGFTNYTPSGVESSQARSVRSFATDESASSVVDLSPRASSESLRSERSAL